MNHKSKYLEWDSNFFNKEIAFVDGVHSSDQQIKKEIDYLFKTGIECIYLHSHKKLDLPEYESVLADRKRSYVMDSPEHVIRNQKGYIKSFSGNPSELYDLALQSGEYSRFRIDPHFSEDEFSRLYRKWIDNSILHGYSDYIFVASDSELEGFITAKIKEGIISIGLFATDRNHRNKGIGTMLIHKIIDIASERELKVEVTTQANNETACRFYERIGFRVDNEMYVYHIWKNN